MVQAAHLLSLGWCWATHQQLQAQAWHIHSIQIAGSMACVCSSLAHMQWHDLPALRRRPAARLLSVVPCSLLSHPCSWYYTPSCNTMYRYPVLIGCQSLVSSLSTQLCPSVGCQSLVSSLSTLLCPSVGCQSLVSSLSTLLRPSVGCQSLVSSLFLVVLPIL